MNIRPFDSPRAEILFFTTVAANLTNYFSNRYQCCVLSIIFEREIIMSGTVFRVIRNLGMSSYKNCSSPD